MAERIRHSLSLPIVLNNITINITVSIGISAFPLDADNIETLIKHADLAMYNAKSKGKNNFQYFIPELNVSAVKRLMVESELQKAVQNHNFIFHYQPILDIKTKKILILEALVRWIHPDKGIIYPQEFISIEEENGLIVPLGDVLFHIIWKFYKHTGRVHFPDLKLAVNISPKQLNDNHIISNI